MKKPSQEYLVKTWVAIRTIVGWAICIGITVAYLGTSAGGAAK